MATTEKIRLITADGKISEQEYEILQHTPHKYKLKGDDGLIISAKHTRVVPTEAYGKSPVIVTSKRSQAICPKCNYIARIITISDKGVCPQHGEFELYFNHVPFGNKDTMTEQETKKTEQESINIAEIAQTQDCELWVRNASFNHENVSAQSYAIIHVKGSRKLCFNTYNGALGKKAILPIDEFVADKEVKGAKNTRPWYKVADLEKERQKLERKGYERYKS